LCAFYRKDYQQALQYFLKAKETDSTYLSGINYVGYAYWSLNRIDSAEYYFNYVIQREPVYDYAANNMLNMYLQNKRDKVDSLLQTFQQKYPDDIWLNERLTEINKNKLIFKK
jgi:tetratricopeptide (TPR) repeat protein